MRVFLRALAGCGMAGLAAAASGDLAPLQPGLDYHSFANVEQFRVTRLELDLRVDSDARVLRGAVGLSVQRLDPGAVQLVLDTRDLAVSDVMQKAQDVLGATSKSETTWVNRPFHFERRDPILGQALVIELPPSKRPTEFIRIDYETSPDAPGLHWLAARQTAGHRRPFLYTLAQPMGTRSWIPLQDTPAARVSYTAILHTASDVLAVMSASPEPGKVRPAKRNGEYAFAMPQAVPPQTISLAVGDLAFMATGPRTGVYAEPSVVKAAAKEFADAESLLASGEASFGAYRWDRYDVVVMPAGYPVGGSGTPPLSLLSPTAIAGDKSLIAIVARDLAHAWSGNLVAHAASRDAWLDEGFAAYLSSRMVEAVYGERRDTMERVLGLEALRSDLNTRKALDQGLAVDWRNRDPGEAWSPVASEKGRLFLTLLDVKFGRQRFDEFLRGYFDHFSFKSISTEQFVNYLQENLLDRFPSLVSRAAVMTWISGAGLPPDAVLPVSAAFEAVDAARRAWRGGARELDARDWVAGQWEYFLETLPPTTPAQLADLDRAFGFARSANAEIAQRWWLVVVRRQYQPGYARLEEYLKTGRTDLVLPLYAALMQTPAGAVQAERVYTAARAGYGRATAAAIDAIVHPGGQSEAGDE